VGNKNGIKIPAFIALFCILVYAAAILYGGYQVYTSVKERKRQGGLELDEIQKLITQSGSEFFTEPFRDRVRKRMTECSSLQGIIIAGSQGPLVFEKEKGSVVRWEPTPDFVPRFGYTSLKKRAVDIAGLKNVTIYSVINAIDYEYIIPPLRQTLLAILGALVISFFTMIITFLRFRNGVLNESPSAKEEAAGHAPVIDSGYEDYSDIPDLEAGFTEENDTGKIDTDNDDEFTMDDAFIDNFSVPEEAAGSGESAGSLDDNFLPDLEPIDTGNGDDDFELPDFDDDVLGETETENTNDDDFHLDDFLDENDLSLPSSEPAESEEEPQDLASEAALQDSSDQADSESAPSGLYSPRSDIGWASYTKDRLASELHRCAASEQDLALLLMECGENVHCDDSLYKKIATEVIELFNLRDLSFEYGDRGITVIIPNAGLEQGINKAEELHSRLMKHHPDSFRSKNDFLTGISSRSGRLVDADRLFMEASRALERAKTEAGPIIAFKSDPEKYREYVRKGSSPD